jgi:dynein heavy chain 2
VIQTVGEKNIYKWIVLFFIYSLETNGRLMELDTKSGELRVNYGDRLVTLMREVRQLSALGFAVPAKIQHVSATAQKFYRHGCILKQVCQFFSDKFNLSDN